NELKAGVDDKLEGLYTEVRKIVSASIETDINKMKKEYFDRVDAYSNGIKRNLQDVETMQLNEEKSMMELNDQIYDTDNED
ncbi:MAG: hypothetical protein LRZ88_02425, partial [Candidatus Cloacimonetes bacterium]|nr:hypothetical protein [Candidatus Cloacimonadota bacterium]